MKQVFAAIPLLFLVTHAQPVSLIEQIHRSITRASNEIVVIAPTFRHIPTAKLLLGKSEKITGIKTYLLTSETYVLEPASYWWSLEANGAKLRTLPKINTYQIFIDGKILYESSEPFVGYEINQTKIYQKSEAQQRCLALIPFWQQAKPLTTENIVRRAQNLPPKAIQDNSQMRCGK
jgi:hypothetical protein